MRVVAVVPDLYDSAPDFALAWAGAAEVGLRRMLPSPALAARYAEQGAHPVAPQLEQLHALVPRLIAGSFMKGESLARHDAERVVLALWPDLAGV